MKKIFLLLVIFLFVFIQPIFSDEISCGGFVLKTLEDSGAFSIAYQENNGKQKDFFISHDEFSTTYFSAKIGNVIYKLNRESSVDFSTYRTENSIGVNYQIGKDIYIYVDLSFAPEFDGVNQSAVKVEVTVQNLSSKSQSVALKGIFDTHLGENSGPHFSTAINPYITSELDFYSMEKDKWIRSSNGRYSIQFLLDGTGITKPSNVVLSNKDVLCNSAWTPVAKPGRSFNSVFSYNNSALAVQWNPMVVSPATKSSVCFYITCSNSGVAPANSDFLGKEIKTSALNVNDEVVYQDEYGTTYTMGALEEAQLDPKYIEDLLNRIRWLEAEPDNVDRNELLQLNAELDAILEKIRQL